MLAKFIGKNYAGFINGRTYRITYECAGEMIFVSALKKKLTIGYDSPHFAKRDWKVI